MKVLILSVSAGGGHLHAANAIAEYLKEDDPTSEVRIIDTIKYISPVLDKVVIGTYLNSLKIYPQAFGFLYSASDNNDQNFMPLLKRVDELAVLKLLPLIRSMEPDILVATHPFTSHMLSVLRKYHANMPNLTIMTDYGAHSMWVHPNIDHYVVAHESIIPELTVRGRSWSSVLPLGIPLRPKFFKRESPEVTQKKFHLDPEKQTITIMGGSLGLGRIRTILQELTNLPDGYNIITITGNNPSLYEEALNIAQKSQCKNIQVLQYCDCISAVFQITDLLITKPGGLTITEAINSQVPMAIFSAVPGQEEQNSQFLLRYGLAEDIDDSQNLSETIQTLLSDQERLSSMKNAMNQVKKPNSTANIAQVMKHMVKKYQQSGEKSEEVILPPKHQDHHFNHLADDMKDNVHKNQALSRLFEYLRMKKNTENTVVEDYELSEDEIALILDHPLS